MAGEHKYINLSYLEGIAEGDKAIIKEFAEIFLEQIPEFTDGFKEGFSLGDWRKIAGIAHKAKSSVMSMGMEDLGNVNLKNTELLAKQLRIIELSSSDIIGEEQKQELEKLMQNLQSYPSEKVDWVEGNADKEILQNLIDEFGDLCEKAAEELNEVIRTY